MRAYTTMCATDTGCSLTPSRKARPVPALCRTELPQGRQVTHRPGEGVVQTPFGARLAIRLGVGRMEVEPAHVIQQTHRDNVRVEHVKDDLLRAPILQRRPGEPFDLEFECPGVLEEAIEACRNNVADIQSDGVFVLECERVTAEGKVVAYQHVCARHTVNGQALIVAFRNPRLRVRS